jgi:CBS domain-containing protein
MSSERISSLRDQISVATIMTRQVVCARKDQPIDQVVTQMLRGHFSSLPVVDDAGKPRGMVTKTDLLELLAKPETIPTTTVEDVMMPIAIVLDERATVAHCASMMAIEDFHHVMIVSSGGTLVGVVSSQDIVRWLAANGSATAL